MGRPTPVARRSVSHGSCVAAGPIALGAGSRIEPWELLKHPAFIIILLRKGADASAGQKLQQRIRRLDRTLLGQANERNPQWSRRKRPWRTLPTWRPLNFVLQIFGTFAAEMVASDFQYGCLLQ